MNGLDTFYGEHFKISDIEVRQLKFRFYAVSSNYFYVQVMLHVYMPPVTYQ